MRTAAIALVLLLSLPLIVHGGTSVPQERSEAREATATPLTPEVSREARVISSLEGRVQSLLAQLDSFEQRVETQGTRTDSQWIRKQRAKLQRVLAAISAGEPGHLTDHLAGLAKDQNQYIQNFARNDATVNSREVKAQPALERQCKSLLDQLEAFEQRVLSLGRATSPELKWIADQRAKLQRIQSALSPGDSQYLKRSLDALAQEQAEYIQLFTSKTTLTSLQANLEQNQALVARITTLLARKGAQGLEFEEAGEKLDSLENRLNQVSLTLTRLQGAVGKGSQVQNLPRLVEELRRELNETGQLLAVLYREIH